MITSTTNDTVKRLVRLRDRRPRDQAGRFLIEGYRELGRAIEHGVAIEVLYICPDLFLGPNEPALIQACHDTGASIVEMTEAPFRKASYRDRPEGLLAEARQFDTGLSRLDLTDNPLLLVVEAIEKPGNLGTMLRTADAAGCRAVIVCDPTTDPFNPNVVRASLGTLFTVPLAVCTTDQAIALLADHNVKTVATTPDTDTLLYNIDLTGPVALIVGSEQYGLSRQWLTAADHTARIPMAGSADSLNAAMAAAVSVFEAVRQR
ncbi:MAG: TrmH family RNA methyltransferase [Acidimicrobiia bacterium]